jgi:hypothetical protein
MREAPPPFHKVPPPAEHLDGELEIAAPWAFREMRTSTANQ